jgi:hypothetical protein
MPFRRPFGDSAVRSRLFVPSGLIPGDVEVDCAELRNRGGEGAGLDCFLQFSCEVHSAKCKGLVVLFQIVESISVRCSSTAEYK